MLNAWSRHSMLGWRSLQVLRQKNLNRPSVVQVEAKSGLDLPLSIKPCSRCRHHVAFAIGITSNQLLSNRVWSAVAVRPMPTTYALPSHRHSAARSATSSPYRSAEVIIAKCIVAVTKPAGGTRPVLMPLPRRACFGYRHIRYQPQSVPLDQNYQTKPIWKLIIHDLIPANRSQSPQCT